MTKSQITVTLDDKNIDYLEKYAESYEDNTSQALRAILNEFQRTHTTKK